MAPARNDGWISQAFGLPIPRRVARWRVRQQIEPYIKGYQYDENGKEQFSQNELRKVVNANVSFYRHMLPPEWRAELLKWACDNKRLFAIIMQPQYQDDVLMFFTEVLHGIAPCIVEVINRERKDYLLRELQEIRQDVEKTA